MNMEIVKKLIEEIEKTYKVIPERPWAKDPQSMTFKVKENGKWFALIMPVKRKSLALDGEGEIWVMNLKAPEDYIMLTVGAKGVIPAYHMNKQHWITVFLDGTVNYSMILSLLDNSYNIVSDSPTKRIYEAVKRIPKGRVATYAQVAAMAGNNKMSRAVGNALHKNPEPGIIPCHRVVDSKGRLAGAFAFGGAGAQAKLLEAEGVEVVNDFVDLKKYKMDDVI